MSQLGRVTHLEGVGEGLGVYGCACTHLRGGGHSRLSRQPGQKWEEFAVQLLFFGDLGCFYEVYSGVFSQHGQKLVFWKCRI